MALLFGLRCIMGCEGNWNILEEPSVRGIIAVNSIERIVFICPPKGRTHCFSVREPRSVFLV